MTENAKRAIKMLKSVAKYTFVLIKKPSAWCKRLFYYHFMVT